MFTWEVPKLVKEAEAAELLAVCSNSGASPERPRLSMVINGGIGGSGGNSLV